MDRLDDRTIDVVLTPLGFEWQHTGGGCTAWLRECNGLLTYITRHDDASAPEYLYESVDIGTYNEESGDLIEWIVQNVPLADALRHVR